MHSLSHMHKSYERNALDETRAAADPLQQFSAWFDEALDGSELEPNAMTLATVDPAGRPSTRVVLIKGFDQDGIVWYSNYHSRKGRDLDGNALAALQFHWLGLQRVVRIEGRVQRLGCAESDAYFDERPLGSRIGAWASPQSQVIAGRAELVQAFAELQRRFGPNPPRPPHWGGYRLAPDYWEFWQGGANRLHDRLCYRWQDGQWRRQRLAP
ncbi:MAG: pyridoxamine 5'-phosphate oxidase [Ottowia sp.]|nr:pyridoxamine 5'-phosphate oxidase [Ottowia sp.]